jgi:hypothetical protein
VSGTWALPSYRQPEQYSQYARHMQYVPLSRPHSLQLQGRSDLQAVQYSKLMLGLLDSSADVTLKWRHTLPVEHPTNISTGATRT